ncbi:MAG: tRNA dihydrouridine synthase DusB [candidate division KSB1 bacterium]|nr:tRNA dihydrouridine synthase DusB [candidate division KSB1 bacterium]MDZ7301119.1 tRNA dihydrouridine synthase DusB [candidate division KSB1 bacterium]MDZ7311997.1 tRNA dihydrouridine synthase DusB [candidate division KSB1 bacterium]
MKDAAPKIAITNNGNIRITLQVCREIFMKVVTTTARQPAFMVHNVPVYGDLILSPMAGFSDLPYRLITRDFGSAMSYTEFISVDGILHGNKNTRRLLDYHPSEYPITFQVFGSDGDKIVEACKKIEQLGPTIIDLNMGCSVAKVSGRGAGAGLLCDPPKIGRIFARLAKELSVPVTGKIRLGWNQQTRNYLTVARILEDNGAALIAVHARTKAQVYSGTADWNAIAEIKQAVKIPVIGNGDVKCVADIDRIKQQTGCDGVMIGRAAIGNPWIFARKDRHQVTFEEKTALIRRHLSLMLDYYGPHYGLILFRKHVVKYITEIRGAAAWRENFLTATTAEHFIKLLEEAEANQRALQAA